METAVDTKPLRTNERQRIGVVLTGLDHALVPVIEYLVTHLNLLQKSIDFEILWPDQNDDLLKYLNSAVPISRQETKRKMHGYAERLRRELKGMIEGYGISEGPPDNFIVLSMATFDDHFYSSSVTGTGVIALGDWRREMAPPTLVEFALVMILRRAVAHVAKTVDGAVHLGTKGCLFDFNPELTDVRLKVLNGHICGTCEQRLEAAGRPGLAEELRRVLQKEWLGLVDERLSPAGICKKLGHDLFLTKGIKPTVSESLATAMHTDALKEFIKIVPSLIVLLLGAYLVYRLGLSVPGR